jgi:hypothetical protein
MQLGLQTFLDKWTEKLREEFDAEIQETRLDIQTTKSIVKTTRLELSQVEARAEQEGREKPEFDGWAF